MNDQIVLQSVCQLGGGTLHISAEDRGRIPKTCLHEMVFHKICEMSPHLQQMKREIGANADSATIVNELKARFPRETNNVAMVCRLCVYCNNGFTDKIRPDMFHVKEDKEGASAQPNGCGNVMGFEEFFKQMLDSNSDEENNQPNNGGNVGGIAEHDDLFDSDSDLVIGTATKGIYLLEERA